MSSRCGFALFVLSVTATLTAVQSRVLYAGPSAPPVSYQVSDLPVFANGTDEGELRDINDKGQVVGIDIQGRPILYSAGTVQDLSPWGVDEPRGISDAGQIVAWGQGRALLLTPPAE